MKGHATIGGMVGQRIREERERQQLTQKDLGTRLGVSFQMVQHFEGGSRLSLDTIARIADALNVEDQWLLCGDSCSTRS